MARIGLTLRLQSFFAGLLALLMAVLLALGAASAKPASGGYQLFEPVALEHQHDIQLASLGNFDYFAKTASECCNATNSETSTLYRAVVPGEYQDIMETGQFRPNPSGDGFQFGKQFGRDLDETIDFADQYPDIGGVVQVKVPNSFLDDIDVGPQVDTNVFPSGTVTIDIDDLDAFNRCISGICDALD